MENDAALLSVREAAAHLSVSESWVRRHALELPLVRLGRLVRFDRSLLVNALCDKTPGTSNRLNPKRRIQVRRYQRGYVFKQGKETKVWYGMWRDDIKHADGTPKRRQRKVRLGTLGEFPTKAAAFEELNRRMSTTPEPVEVAVVEMTFRETVEKWKEAVAPTIEKDSTAIFYIGRLDSHLVPKFGEWKLSAIGKYDIQKFLAEQAARYCRNTLRGMKVSLGLVLSWAVACKWLNDNPCVGIKLPRAGSRVKRTVLRPDQVVAFANRLHEPYATLVLFLVTSGLRIGEAIAIRWSDFEGDVLHVSRRIYEGRVDTTKTESSVRSLPIPAALLSRMRQLGGSDWVFRSRVGKPVNPGNALKRYVRPLAKELAIPIGGWHDFRHTFSTRLLRKWPTKVVSEMLGHSNVRTTLDTYHHTEAEDFRAPLNELAGELLPLVTTAASVQ